MIPDASGHPGERLSDAQITPLVAAFVAGDVAATERLAALLSNHARITAEEFLKPDHAEIDDLAQDAVVAVLDALRRRGGFEGSVVHFAIAVTRNRCRNWLLWRRRHATASLDPYTDRLAARDPDPLDLLEADEVRRLVQRAVDRLDDLCRDLLHALYVEGATVEQMRLRAGLKSVQSIYYRHAKCLLKAGELLKKRLGICSFADGVENEPRCPERK
ncbi:MAG: sigma-70 family RNA polymerase sigma factor [bacterium]|nr:sigma-70 family RNA polymerase sigma factor [bacterium]